MRHYDYDEEDENEDIDKFFEEDRDDDEEPDPVYAEFGDDDFETEFLDSDIELMHVALKMCEKSWFWRFRSLKTKLTMVATTYATLKRIM